MSRLHADAINEGPASPVSSRRLCGTLSPLGAPPARRTRRQACLASCAHRSVRRHAADALRHRACLRAAGLAAARAAIMMGARTARRRRVLLSAAPLGAHAPAGACAPSGAADRSTRRRRAVRAPIMIAARAAARPAARKQARCRSASAACRRTDRCAQLARQACRRVRRAGGAPSGDKVPHSRREDTGEAGPSLIASACSRLTMMAPSVVHH